MENIKSDELYGKDNETDEELFKQFETVVNETLKIRNRPLLVMFYSDPVGEIIGEDISMLEQVFDDFLNKKGKRGFLELDLLIHTYGGGANTSYRLIKLIRTYCKRLNVLVASHSYSGGILITFGADKIEIGRSATLSPIDVQVGDESLPLLSIEKYIEFLENCSTISKIKEDKNKTKFITELTKKLVKEVGAVQLGEFFRLRGLTVLHSKSLLENHMFKNYSDKDERIMNIISKFNQESPTHHFEMDFDLIKESGRKNG